MGRLAILLCLLGILSLASPQVYELGERSPSHLPQCSGVGSRGPVPSDSLPLPLPEGFSLTDVDLRSLSPLVFLVNNEEEWNAWRTKAAVDVRRCSGRTVRTYSSLFYDCSSYCGSNYQIDMCTVCQPLAIQAGSLRPRSGCATYSAPPDDKFISCVNEVVEIMINDDGGATWTDVQIYSAGVQLLDSRDGSIPLVFTNCVINAPAVHIESGSDISFQGTNITSSYIEFLGNGSLSVTSADWDCSSSMTADVDGLVFIDDSLITSEENIMIISEAALYLQGSHLSCLRQLTLTSEASDPSDHAVSITSCILDDMDLVITGTYTSAEGTGHHGIYVRDTFFGGNTMNLQGTSQSGSGVWMEECSADGQVTLIGDATPSLPKPAYGVHLDSCVFESLTATSDLQGHCPTNSIALEGCSGVRVHNCTFENIGLNWQGRGEAAVECTNSKFTNSGGSVQSLMPYCTGQKWEHIIFIDSSVECDVIGTIDDRANSICLISDHQWQGTLSLSNSHVQLLALNSVMPDLNFASVVAPILFSSLQMSADESSSLKANVTAEGFVSQVFLAARSQLVSVTVHAALVYSEENLATIILLEECGKIDNSHLIAEIRSPGEDEDRATFNSIIGVSIQNPTAMMQNSHIKHFGSQNVLEATTGLLVMAPDGFVFESGSIDVAIDSYGADCRGIMVSDSRLEWTDLDISAVVAASPYGTSSYSAFILDGGSGHSWVNLTVTVAASSLARLTEAHGISISDVNGLALENVTISGHVGATSSSCSGVHLLRSNLELQGPVVFESSDIAGEEGVCAPMLWDTVLAVADRGVTSLALHGVGGYEGVFITQTKLLLEQNDLLVHGEASERGVRLSDSSIDSLYLTVNGSGIHGISLGNNVTLEARDNAVWNFTGNGQISFFTERDFILPERGNAVFFLSGNTAKTNGSVSIDWGHVEIEPAWTANDIAINGDSTVSVGTLTASTGDIQVGSGESETILAGDSLTAFGNVMVRALSSPSIRESSLFQINGTQVYLPSGLSGSSENVHISAIDGLRIGSDLENIRRLILSSPDFAIGTLFIDTTERVEMRDSKLTIGNQLAISTPLFLFLNSTVFDADSQLRLVGGGCEIDEQSSVGCQLYLNEAESRFRVNGAASLVTLIAGFLVGGGTIDSLQCASDQAVVRPDLLTTNDAMIIGTLQGNCTYQVRVSGNSSAQLRVGTRFSDLRTEFDVLAPWSGETLFPIVRFDLSRVTLGFALLNADQSVIPEGQEISLSTLTGYASYRRSYEGYPAFSIGISPDPTVVAQDDAASFQCPNLLCNGTFCLDVVANDTASDGTNLLELVRLSDTFRWSLGSSRNVCFRRQPEDRIQPVSNQYIVQDGNGIQGVASVEFSFERYIPKSPTPTPNMASITLGLSPSPKLSGSSSGGSKSPFVSPSSISRGSSRTPTAVPSTSGVPSSSESRSRSPSLPAPSSSPSLSFSRTASPRQSTSASFIISDHILPPEAPASAVVTRVPFTVPAQFTRSPQPSQAITRMPSVSSRGTIATTQSVLRVVSEPCGNCERGSVRVPLSDVNEQFPDSPPNTADQVATRVRVGITLDGGRTVGTIEIPPGLVTNPDEVVLEANTVTVDRNARRVNGGQRIGSVVTDITLQSLFGRISNLNEPLTICLEADEGVDDQCLGYYNEDKGEWECEDRCLEKDGNTYCGDTGHLTSFALLLGGGNRKCEDGDDTTFIWVSIGFVGGALVAVLVAIALIEIRICLRRNAHQRFLHTLSQRRSVRLSGAG